MSASDKNLTEKQTALLDNLTSMRAMRMKPNTVVTAMPQSERGSLVELIWALSDVIDGTVDSAQTVRIADGKQKTSRKPGENDAAV